MAKSRFLIKGGKGKIGLGQRQVVKTDIIPVYNDTIDELFGIRNELFDLRGFSKNIDSRTVYSSVPCLEMKKDDFSESELYFNPNSYIITKNSKGEVFFGIDSKKNSPMPRFDPRGSVIRLHQPVEREGEEFVYRGVVDFYCLPTEKPVYKDGSIVFYKIFVDNPNYLLYVDFKKHRRYNFSIIRESIPSTQNSSNVDVKGVIKLKEGSPNPVTKIWSGTQQQYNAVTTKEADVLYFIVEE